MAIFIVVEALFGRRGKTAQTLANSGLENKQQAVQRHPDSLSSGRIDEKQVKQLAVWEKYCGLITDVSPRTLLHNNNEPDERLST